MQFDRALIEELNRYTLHPTPVRAPAALKQPRILKAAAALGKLKRDEAITLNLLRRQNGKPPLNHRDFLLASVAIGVVRAKGGRLSWLIQVNTNRKPYQTQPKSCAERQNGRVLLFRRACLCITGILNVSEEDADSRSGKVGPKRTADICDWCRDDGNEEFLDGYDANTLLINHNPVTNEFTKPRTLVEVYGYHGEIWLGSNRRSALFRGGGR